MSGTLAQYAVSDVLKKEVLKEVKKKINNKFHRLLNRNKDFAESLKNINEDNIVFEEQTASIVLGTLNINFTASASQSANDSNVTKTINQDIVSEPCYIFEEGDGYLAAKGLKHLGIDNALVDASNYTPAASAYSIAVDYASNYFSKLEMPSSADDVKVNTYRMTVTNRIKFSAWNIFVFVTDNKGKKYCICNGTVTPTDSSMQNYVLSVGAITIPEKRNVAQRVFTAIFATLAFVLRVLAVVLVLCGKATVSPIFWVSLIGGGVLEILGVIVENKVLKLITRIFSFILSAVFPLLCIL